MTEEDKNLLNSFEGKLRHVLLIQVLLSKIKELETRYANLKMARMISVNDDEIRDTKQRLTRLVREVDKCIALLNK